MKHLFYTSSKSAWAGLLSTIASAEKSIYLEMYIFLDDTPEGVVLMETLMAKAERGVQVKMILDRFGSYGLSNATRDKLKKAGIELLFFSKFFRRLHRKLVVVDEKIGFLGGVNIHKDARLWDDLLIKVEGRIVHSMIRSFRRIYKQCGGKDAHILDFKQKAILGKTRVWLFEHVPYIRAPRLRDTYSEVIEQAKESIVLVTPYFLPHRWMTQHLREAVARGVRVEVIVPEKTDYSLLTKANMRYMTMLSPDGVHFLQTKTMNHAKVLLVDNKLGLVGSQNIDALSFDFNAEIGVFFTNPEMVRGLRKIVEQWKLSATTFIPAKKISIGDQIISFIIRLLQPFL
jgi:cardiolipin synthase